MSRYRLSLRAKADLDEIWSYVATKSSIDVADRLIDTIAERFPVIAKMPEAGRLSEVGEFESRVFPAEQYLIYYQKSVGGVLISRVIHGMRDQRTAWAQKP